MASKVRRRLASMVAAGGLAIMALPATAGAQAPPLNINCTTAGTVTVLGQGPATWSLSGRGSCFGDFNGTYFIDFVGTGTSQTLGFCSPSPDTVRNLSINVTATLTNTATLASRALLQRWYASETTFPVTTPFVIERTGHGDVGAGTLFTRVFGKCPSLGSPVSTFHFSFQAPPI